MDTITDKSYSIEDLVSILGTSSKQIAETINGNPQLKAFLNLDPEPASPIYKIGDSKLTITAEGAKELTRVLGLDPALLG